MVSGLCSRSRVFLKPLRCRCRQKSAARLPGRELDEPTIATSRDLVECKAVETAAAYPERFWLLRFILLVEDARHWIDQPRVQAVPSARDQPLRLAVHLPDLDEVHDRQSAPVAGNVAIDRRQIANVLPCRVGPGRRSRPRRHRLAGGSLLFLALLFLRGNLEEKCLT